MAGQPTYDVIIVMGVSGCGKSTQGAELAAHLGWSFRDGDDFHSKESVMKMKNGHPLTDTDRLPWLRALSDHVSHNPRTVIACSALRRSYRDILRNEQCSRLFVFLSLSRSQLEDRVKHRRDHFMASCLLESQLSTLEAPTQDEKDVIVIDCDGMDRMTVTKMIEKELTSRQLSQR